MKSTRSHGARQELQPQEPPSVVIHYVPKLTQSDYERITEIVRTELRYSFWQGLSVALAVFILTLFVILMQK